MGFQLDRQHSRQICRLPQNGIGGMGQGGAEGQHQGGMRRMTGRTRTMLMLKRNASRRRGAFQHHRVSAHRVVGLRVLEIKGAADCGRA